MFKNDRMMMILTGLVLAIFAGSMVKYGDRIMGLMSGEHAVASQDDSYSIRAGSSQILDVLSNDDVRGPIVVLTRPTCGGVELTGNNKLTFNSDGCSGEVEFAYCVDADGKCNPNAVRLNVISVDYNNQGGAVVAQAPAAQPATIPANTQPAENPAPPSNSQAAAVAQGNEDDGRPEIVGQEEPLEVAAATQAPSANDTAPQLNEFAIEMAPPSLAAPSVSELISPDVAVASIRQPSGGLNSAANIDQNISTQNSAGRAQPASAAPSSFQAPTLGEASNIALGGTDISVAAAPSMPTGLQVASDVGLNIVQLERGPEALASISASQATPLAQESAPLAANPERNSFVPVDVAAAQTESPTLENSFSAAPIDGGPIALIALQSTAESNAAAGESLNVILSEPGLQTFASAASLPSALAPVVDGPSAVSILEREPSASLTAPALSAPPATAEQAAIIAQMQDRLIARSPFVPQSASGNHDASFASYGRPVTTVANPVQVSAEPINLSITMSPIIMVSKNVDPISRAPSVARFAPPSPQLFSLPSINATPASLPETVQVASIFTADVPIVTAPVQQSTCAIELTAAARSGANIQLDILSACKPGQMVNISHAGIEFSAMTDSQGAARVAFPAMERDAEVTVTFADLSSQTTNLTVRDTDSFVRAAISWQANINLDLNAFEFGAANGADGHVYAQQPRDYRTSRIKGGGYLIQLGDPALTGGAFAEIYSLPVVRSQQRGTIELSILLDDAAQVCGQVIQAQTSRTREGLTAVVRNVRFNVPECGTVTGQITLPGAIDDIRVAGR